MAGPRNKRTSNVGGHMHTYIIDAEGNGRTSRVCHPDNPTICHSHRISKYKVEEAPSECYPNCTGAGAPGLGPHIHEITLGKLAEERIRQLQNRPTRFRPSPSVLMGKKKFINKRRRLAEKQNTLPPNQQGGINTSGNSGIGDDLGFDDFNPDSGGSTNPGGNTGGGSGGSGGNTGGGGY